VAKTRSASRLGKGLGALLPDDDFADAGREGSRPAVPGKSGQRGAGPAAGSGGETLVPIDSILANPGQPRKHFDEAGLSELAASIKQHGIIQPVVVDELEKNAPHGTTYVIIAGERRCRAAKLAGLSEIPVVIKNYSTGKRLEVALVENIHRQDLSPLEEASAYKQIMEDACLSQDGLAARVGKNRSTVANALRLLKLPGHMRESLEDGSLSPGHARAVLSLARPEDQEKLYREITAKALSVRAAEKRALELGSGGGNGKKKAGLKPAAGRDPELKALEEKMIETLGTKVTIDGTLKKGRIEIEYYSMDDLDRLYGLLGSRGNAD
jgi:ParB family chromosome partitioning protein